jgi:hypothetical protein
MEYKTKGMDLRKRQCVEAKKEERSREGGSNKEGGGGGWHY